MIHTIQAYVQIQLPVTAKVDVDGIPVVTESYITGVLMPLTCLPEHLRAQIMRAVIDEALDRERTGMVTP